MVDGRPNPYRTDIVADTLFVGREGLLTKITTSVLARRNALHAVMGGRGMGKSSFAKQLQKRVGAEAITVVASGNVQRITAEVSHGFLVDLATDSPVDALVRASNNHPSGRALLIIDEIEKTLEDPSGVAFLDNLRDAYERASGSLGVVVLGGTGVRDLLLSEASPFLRIAGPIHTLTGLERGETASLMREPLQLDIPDEIVDALWAETAGHPWLLQMFLEIAVERAGSLTEVAGHLAAAMREAESRLHSVAFPIWWRNLREEGQQMYRRVVSEPMSVPRDRWVARFWKRPTALARGSGIDGSGLPRR